MSVSDSIGSPIPRKGIEYPRLTLPEYGTLEDGCRALRDERAEKVLDKFGIRTPADRAAAMLQVSNKDLSTGDVNAFLGRKRGAEFALKLSLKKAGKSLEEIKEIVATFDALDAIELARALVFAGVYAYGEQAEAKGEADTSGELLDLLSPTPDAETSDDSTPAPTPQA